LPAALAGGGKIYGCQIGFSQKNIWLKPLKKISDFIPPAKAGGN
jgi:hypothetical protein